MNNKMMPIVSETKAKRRRWGCESSVITWAWYKELKENNDTKKIYKVNPNVEVYRFRDNLYGFLADNLDGQGDEWMYLINGPKKAMLIDTGYGLGNTRGLADEITGGKELVVVNTHDHYDHAYGNCRFDKVYCHEHLVPFLESQHEHMWDYIFDALGQPIWVDFDRKDLPKFKKYEIVGVPDGYTWDLGDGYEVELIFTGGHCAGHAMYLDKKNRILFTGDNLCSDTCSCGNIGKPKPGGYPEDSELELCRERFRYLADRIEEYDVIFPQHHINDLDNTIIVNTLDTLDKILKAPENYDYIVEKYGKSRTEKTQVYLKYIQGFSAVRYECGERSGRNHADNL